MSNLIDDTTGATAIEYGLVVALIGIAIIGTFQAVAGEVIEMWTDVETRVTEAIGKGPQTPPPD